MAVLAHERPDFARSTRSALSSSPGLVEFPGCGFASTLWVCRLSCLAVQQGHTKGFTPPELSVKRFPMTTPDLQVRRATVEDLRKLFPLWQQEGIPTEGLEKRFKEFQVIEAAGGEVAGAIGLEIVGLDCRLHSEAFGHPEHADALRALLWQRIEVISNNHGLARIWIQTDAPYWTHSTFVSATDEQLAKKPEQFTGDTHPWHVRQLRDDSPAPVSIDKEFDAFRQLEREQTAKLMERAKFMRVVAALAVVAVFFVLAFGIVLWLKARNNIPQ